jgi:hemerythrin
LDFVWTEKLAVGVREIDIQHKFLFAKINDLGSAMDSNDTSEQIEKFFVFLEEYTASHFAMEQKAMGVYKYPDMAAHIEQHNVFIRSIRELKASFNENGVTEALTSELRERLCDWLVEHVSKVDRALGAFLKPRAKAL